MSKIAIKGATTGTGVFTLESPATNTDRTLILPDEAGTVLTSASDVAQKGVPAFRAELRTNTAFSTATWTLVPLSTSVFDTASCFDIGTYKYTPNVAGYYQFISTSRFSGSSLGQVFTAIMKNSTSLASGEAVASQGLSMGTASANPTIPASCVIYMNGTTDYVCLLAYAEGNSLNFDYSSAGFCNFLSGVLVRAD